MTADSFFRDLVAFSIQIAFVGIGIAALLKLVKIPAGVRYAGLRLALVASLVVPWILRAPAAQAPALATTALVPAPVSASGAPAPLRGEAGTVRGSESRPTIPWTRVGLGALLIGIAARVAWLGLGVIRLLRLKRAGVVVDAAEYLELQQQIGTRATITQVPALPQPATFGVRRPIVLLPDSLEAASSSLRRAVVAHELFHVRRRDWLAVLAEEAVRTALWFHPAILWMTSQIQLAREEIVDELTVQATGDRRTYVEALLAFADTPGLSPAPAFAHRRQLFHRILSVSKGKVMSRPRIVSSAAVLIAAVSGASWYASTLFPILKAAKVDAQATAPASAGDQSPAQSGSRLVLGGNVEVRDGNRTLRAARAEVLLDEQGSQAPSVRPVTPENPIPRRSRGVTPVRPAQFSGAGVVVISLVTLDRNGAVTAVVRNECGVTDGRKNDSVAVCAAFFDSVAAAIRQWRYDRPVQGPIQFYVTITFRPGEEPTVTQSSESRAPSLREAQDGVRALAEQRRRDSVATDDSLRAQAEVERVNNQLRELERAQRLVERGLLSNQNYTRMQAELAQLNAARARAEAQTQNARSQETDDVLKAQLDAVAAQFREVERAQRSAIERGSPNPDMVKVQQELARLIADLARVQAQLREVDSPRAAEAQALAEQYRDAARRFEETRAQQSADDQARAEEGRRRLTEQMREVERRVAEARLAAQLERRPTADPTPTTAVDGSRQLVSPSGRAPLRVSPPVTAPVPIKTVKPQHSAEAMRARAEGTVILEALVDEQGRVADARVVKSIPLLDQSALDAAKQWEFKPATLNGEPVPVLIQLELNFTVRK